MQKIEAYKVNDGTMFFTIDKAHEYICDKIGENLDSIILPLNLNREVVQKVLLALMGNIDKCKATYNIFNDYLNNYLSVKKECSNCKHWCNHNSIVKPEYSKCQYSGTIFEVEAYANDDTGLSMELITHNTHYCSMFRAKD